MLKKIMAAVIFICAVAAVSGCRLDDGNESAVKEASTVDTGYKVYCLNALEPEIKAVNMDYTSETTETLIGECITALSKDPERRHLQAAIQEPLQVIEYSFDEESKQANIYFNAAYREMSKEKELLVRSAVVMTLTQFDTLIDYVCFYVENQPLTDAAGNELVMMAADFVDSTSADIKNLNEETLTLYFASTDGTQLAPEEVRVHYKNTATLESVVVERLITGPLSDTLNRTFSADTKLNGISLEKGLCTVDFNGKFLEEVNNQSFNVKVYSVVDSLCALDGIDSVQILINGQVYKELIDGVSIENPLEMNEEIIVKPVDAPPAVTTETETSSGSGADNTQDYKTPELEIGGNKAGD